MRFMQKFQNLQHSPLHKSLQQNVAIKIKGNQVRAEKIEQKSGQENKIQQEIEPVIPWKWVITKSVVSCSFRNKYKIK